MLMPSIFGENLLDDFFGLDDSFRGYQKKHRSQLMKTDVKEGEKEYELDINLPGYKKEDIHVELNSGYVTIQASTSQSNDVKDESTGNYIRWERYSGSCSRSFYVGDEIREEDIRARYENGVLSLTVPKREAKQIEAEQKKYIAIEG